MANNCAIHKLYINRKLGGYYHKWCFIPVDKIMTNGQIVTGARKESVGNESPKK